MCRIMRFFVNMNSIVEVQSAIDYCLLNGCCNFDEYASSFSFKLK